MRGDREARDRTPRSLAVDAIVLGIAVSVFGVSFGVLAVSTGLTVAQTCVMSALVFTGASQFALVGVVASGGSPLAGLASALLLSLRNGAYGLALSRVVTGRWPRRAVAAQLAIDETTAMTFAQSDNAIRERAFWWTGLSLFVFWNLGTLLGAIGGSWVGDPEALGLDAAFPAGFVALLAPHWRRPEARRVAIVATAIGVVLVPLAPQGVPIIAAAGAVVVGMRSR